MMEDKISESFSADLDHNSVQDVIISPVHSFSASELTR
jgi:hypothetical protein